MFDKNPREKYIEELSEELKIYFDQLMQMDRAQLLEEMYQVKRSKYPEKYALIESALKSLIEDTAKEEKVRKWVESLVGTTIVLNPLNGPVKITEAKLNSRKNAAIISVEGDTRTHYISYKGE